MMGVTLEGQEHLEIYPKWDCIENSGLAHPENQRNVVNASDYTTQEWTAAEQLPDQNLEEGSPMKLGRVAPSFGTMKLGPVSEWGGCGLGFCVMGDGTECDTDPRQRGEGAFESQRGLMGFQSGNLEFNVGACDQNDGDWETLCGVDGGQSVSPSFREENWSAGVPQNQLLPSTKGKYAEIEAANRQLASSILSQAEVGLPVVGHTHSPPPADLAQSERLNQQGGNRVQNLPVSSNLADTPKGITGVNSGLRGSPKTDLESVEDSPRRDHWKHRGVPDSEHIEERSVGLTCGFNSGSSTNTCFKDSKGTPKPTFRGTFNIGSMRNRCIAKHRAGGSVDKARCISKSLLKKEKGLTDKMMGVTLEGQELLEIYPKWDCIENSGLAHPENQRNVVNASDYTTQEWTAAEQLPDQNLEEGSPMKLGRVAPSFGTPKLGPVSEWGGCGLGFYVMGDGTECDTDPRQRGEGAFESQRGLMGFQSGNLAFNVGAWDQNDGDWETLCGVDGGQSVSPSFREENWSAGVPQNQLLTSTKGSEGRLDCAIESPNDLEHELLPVCPSSFLGVAESFPAPQSQAPCPFDQIPLAEEEGLFDDITAPAGAYWLSGISIVSHDFLQGPEKSQGLDCLWRLTGRCEDWAREGYKFNTDEDDSEGQGIDYDWDS
ncbi:UNVERIFIED_CONTAM: hypothetical protein FKN15_017882 [Acipenser sinensis]